MKKRVKIILMGCGILAGWSLVLWLVFRALYAPNILLHDLFHGRKTAEEHDLLQLERMALDDRFDMTDSLRMITLAERAGKNETAFRMYDRLSRRYPEDTDLAIWQADYLNRHGAYEQADARYQAALDRLPRERRANLLKALARNAAKAAADPAQADQQTAWREKSAAYYAQCLELAPEALDAKGEYAALLLDLGDPAQSLRLYEEMLQTDPDNPGWLDSAATASAAARNFDKAEKYLFMLNVRSPSPATELQLARVYYWGGNYAEALPRYQRLVEQDPLNRSLIRERLDVLHDARHTDDFLRESARYLAIHPYDRALWQKRVDLALEQNDLELAERETAAMLVAFPTDFEARLQQARIRIWRRRFESARRDLAVLLEQAPDRHDLLKWKALANLWDQQPDQAVAWFRRMDPVRTAADREAATGYAETLEQLGTLEPGDQPFVDALLADIAKREPSALTPASVIALARVMRKNARNETADRLFILAQELRPRDAQLRIEYADFLQDIGRHEEADRIYRTVLE